MSNVSVNQSTLEAVKGNVNTYSGDLNATIDSLISQLESGKEAYVTNGGSIEHIDNTLAELRSIKNDYGAHNNEFMQVLTDTVSNYNAADVQTGANVSALDGTSPVVTAGEGGASSSGSPSISGSVNQINPVNSAPVVTAGESKNQPVAGVNTAPATSAAPLVGGATTSSTPNVSGGPGVVGASSGERPSWVPENATQLEDGRWAVMNPDGTGVIYNNTGGIQGTPYDSNDPLVRALASTTGGEVVKLDDGRIAVRDKMGGGTIFNKDGSTTNVSSQTIVAGEVERVQGNSGADPYTQEVANQVIEMGLSDTKIDGYIEGLEEKMEAGKLASELSVDPDALRNAIENQQTSGMGPGVYNTNGNSTITSDTPKVQASPTPYTYEENKGNVINAGWTRVVDTPNAGVQQQQNETYSNDGDVELINDL